MDLWICTGADEVFFFKFVNIYFVQVHTVSMILTLCATD